MKPTYNLIAGKNIERIAALSDGVFAIAMTLLVLDLHVPASELIHSEKDLWTAIIALSPSLIAYLMSFMTLGIFWVGQQTQLNHIAKSDRNLTWLQIGFLLAVSLIPFSTGFLAEFFIYKTAIWIYWLNIFLLGSTLYLSRGYAWKSKLIKDDVTSEVWKAGEKRIIISLTIYTIGAALSFFNTYLSISMIILVQLNYVFAPKIKFLNKF